jgi:hypothetical protein
MTAALAGGLHPGDAVHIGPHDIFRNDPTGPSVHKDTRHADVRVDDVVPVGRVVVIMWHAGTILGAVVYDANDLVQLLAGAA